MPRLHMLIFAVPMLLAACATPRFDTSRVDSTLTPTGVVLEPQPAGDSRVQWGGTVLQVHNGKDGTEVEVFAYPLWASGRPRPDRSPLGRFLATTSEYWDPAEFVPGRLLTVVGPVTGTRQGRVGDADLLYPVVAVEQLQLWPTEYLPKEPRVRFGVGLIFH